MKFKPRDLLVSTAVIAVLGSAACYGMREQFVSIAPVAESEVGMTATGNVTVYTMMTLTPARRSLSA